MKHFITTGISVFAINCFLLAQTNILNGNFESWQNVGSSTEEPTQWNSNKTGGGNAPTGPQTCFRESNNPHGGQFCARVQSGSILGIVVNGSLTTGKVEAPSTNKAEGYIRTIANDPNYSMPFTGRPDSLIFWYRYTKQGNDYPRVEARLHVGNAYAPEAPVNNNHPDSTVNIIARAQWQGPASSISSWTRVAVPFVYVDNRTPQYILITTTSSGDQTGGTSGSTLWLDDFEVYYTPAVQVGNVQPLTYYLSQSSGASIQIPYTLLGNFSTSNTVTAELSNSSGSFATPVVLGNITANQSGTVAGVIPAGTPDGNGYRVRVTTSQPSLISPPGANALTIVNVSNSVSPAVAQNITQGSPGNPLTVTETPGATGRNWKFSTTSGGPYTNFTPAQTSLQYTPLFQSGGTYYVVCETNYPGGTNVTSNEVTIYVSGNYVTPAGNQSIPINTNGNPLTVTETSPATSRQWKYGTSPGGPYQAFTPSQTGITYTPNFSTAGTYFVVCESVINGNTVTSNAVEIEVFTPYLITGSISGSPFEFSPSAPAATISVPFTVTSAVFQYNNTFFAQLSDANGSFATPTIIGSYSGTSSGVITANISPNTPAGTGYRIRVVGTNPPINGSNNGTDLVVDQFHNNVTPDTPQSILHSTNGSPLSVTASQNSLHEWKYTTTSGGGYVSFIPPETGSAYTPYFTIPDTYYVVCVSINQYNDAVISNEVPIFVLNGNTLQTTTVSGSPYYISPSANVTAQVSFASNVVFAAGNVFNVQMSDYNGSFSSPVNIGSLSSTQVAPVPVTIPNNLPAGNKYRMRVVSTQPPVTGSDNGTDLTVIPFEISLAPPDTQYLTKNQAGTPISITETHPATREWLWSEVPGIGYAGFNPPQTGTSYTPQFQDEKIYYVICRSQNTVGDVLTSQEVVIVVQNPQGIANETEPAIKMQWSNGRITIENHSRSQRIHLFAYQPDGKLWIDEFLTGSGVHCIAADVPAGLYIVRLTAQGFTKTFKVVVR
ncbi:MAG: PCMD domain-containing protein [Chitinophagales bacterium]|nr:PCMD domain-containing protein [Chitinophagales bacterium]